MEVISCFLPFYRGISGLYGRYIGLFRLFLAYRVI